MDLWFSEDHHDGWELSIRVDRVLATEHSQYQRIDILQTRDFGVMLVLDGKVQACQMDEFIYHEMLVHVPMLCHPEPRRVLVAGGGDGGSMREVMGHPSVEVGYLVDIDQRVIALCQEFMPGLAGPLVGEKRLVTVARDAAEQLRESQNLDVILVDSSDPEGPSERLFGCDFYDILKAALRPDGVVALQAGSPFFYREQIARTVADLRERFAVVRPYQIPMPTYPSGYWTLVLASDVLDPVQFSPEVLAQRLEERGIRPRYYTPEIHHGALALPPFLADAIRSHEAVQA